MHRSILFAAAIFAAGCDRARPVERHAAAEDASARGVRLVHLAAGVQTDANIRTERLAREVLGRTVEITGEIAALPDRSARVSSPVAGRLDAIRFGEGETVRRGEPLATLRVPDLGRIRGDLAAAAARATAARADANRLKMLSEKELATEQSYLDAEARAKSHEAEVAAVKEQLSAMGAPESASGFLVTLRAPVDGVVISRDAVVGQPLRSDQTIATLADLSRVWFLGQAFERSLPLVELRAPSRIRFAALPGKTFEGRVELVGRALDPATRAATVRIPLDNRDGALRIGMTGQARITAELDAGAAVLSVSRSALTDLGGRRVVFVRRSAEDFEARDVDTGTADADRVSLLRGVAEGDEVVVDGVFTLKSIALKSTFAEE